MGTPAETRHHVDLHRLLGDIRPTSAPSGIARDTCDAILHTFVSVLDVRINMPSVYMPIVTNALV